MVSLFVSRPRDGLCDGGADFSQRWIVDDDWTYTADISPLTKNLTEDTKALLVLYGVDTIANIVRAACPRFRGPSDRFG